MSRIADIALAPSGEIKINWVERNMPVLRALGLPIYPIEQDGFALFDAIAGELPVIREGVTGRAEEYYQYNQNG